MSENSTLRFFSAIILAPLALGATYLGNWYLAFFASTIGIIGLREWDRVSGYEFRGLVAVVRLWVVVPSAAGFSILGIFEGVFISIIVGIMATLVLVRGKKTSSIFPLIGPIYLVLPLVALIWIREGTVQGSETLIWLFVVVWSSDIGGISFGKMFGGPKMIPKISPKKTWTGAIGAVLFPAIIGVVTAIVFEPTTITILVLLSAGLGIFSQIGDLVESTFKRLHGVKNSGNLIPGHGGVLDRIDSLLFVLPMAALVLFLNDGAFFVWQ